MKVFLIQLLLFKKFANWALFVVFIILILVVRGILIAVSSARNSSSDLYILKQIKRNRKAIAKSKKNKREE